MSALLNSSNCFKFFWNFSYPLFDKYTTVNLLTDSQQLLILFSNYVKNTFFLNTLTIYDNRTLMSEILKKHHKFYKTLLEIISL